MDSQPGVVATLEWGVKQSFRAYVEGTGGAIETGEGASRVEGGAFRFEAAPGAGLTVGADGKLTGAGRFSGAVRFEAHGGMLDVFLADPSLEVGPEGASVKVADSRERDSRLELALLDLAAATQDDDGALLIPARLSKDGWRILGDHYPPGTPLDPVKLTALNR